MFGDDSGLSQINYHFKDKSLGQFQKEFKKDLNALNDAHMAERDSKGNKEGACIFHFTATISLFQRNLYFLPCYCKVNFGKIISAKLQFG